MKPETEIRNLLREVNMLRKKCAALERDQHIYRGRCTRAEIETAEWKGRFDRLLEKMEKPHATA